MDPLKNGIPVATVRSVAEELRADIVVIHAWREEETGPVFTATYGRTTEHKYLAALWGKESAQAMGFDTSQATSFDDFRLKRIAELEAKLQAIASYWQSISVQDDKSHMGELLRMEPAEHLAAYINNLRTLWREKAELFDAACEESLTETWTCFHCGFRTCDHAEARAHFGDGPDDAALCVEWSQMDGAKELQAKIQELNSQQDENRRLLEKIEGLEFQVDGVEAAIASRFKNCRTIDEAWHAYDSMEGRALAAEEHAKDLKTQAKKRTISSRFLKQHQKGAIRLALAYMEDMAGDDEIASESELLPNTYRRAFRERKKRCLELCETLRSAFPGEARQYDAESK